MRGREESFRQFVAARSPALLRLAYLICTDPATAEDVVQTALVRAYGRWGRIHTNAEAYVRRVIVTVAADERRRPYRREVPTEVLPETSSGDASGSFGERDELRRAMRELPVGQRTAVVLRHWVGLSVAETAELMACSEGTVRSQALRGLEKLRAVYLHQADETRGTGG